MKLLLKLILILCSVFAGIYASTPLWLPHILASQLPAGWRLEDMQSSYPGAGGISIDHLRLKVEPGPADIELDASDIYFRYRDFKTDIGLLALDVQWYDLEQKPAAPLTLNDLSFPSMQPGGKLPQLSVSEMRIVLHKVTGLHDEAFRPFTLDLENLDLTPFSDQAYQLESDITVAGLPQLRGRLEVEVKPELVNAMIRFPGSMETMPWLVLEAEQANLGENTETRIKANLDSNSGNREWLDALVAGGTGRLFTQLGGKLETEASFAGQGVQRIESLALTSDKLQLMTGGGTLDIDASLVAKREGERVAIELAEASTLQYQGEVGRIDEVLQRLIPGLQLTHGATTKILSELGSDGRLLFQPGDEPSVEFMGDLRIELVSEIENLTLHTTGIQIVADGLGDTRSVTTDGLVTFSWQLNAPLAYSTGDLSFETGQLSIAGELSTGDGKLLSKGGGSLRQVQVATHDVFAEEIEVEWQELDLIELTGNLYTRTKGFSAEYDRKTWTGFDFDVNYQLPGKDEVNGAGAVNFTTGQQFPIEFDGNMETQRWAIQLLPVTIQLPQLRELLSAVHYQVPESIKLIDGYIDLEGDVLLADEITARLRVSGREVAASMLKSSARQTRFSFDSGYDKAPWVSGPVTIDTITLAGGVEATNFSSQFELESSGQFTLRDVSAELFDGDLALGSVRFSGNQMADTTIELKHIDLGLLLEYADIDGLEGTGFLDVSLPVGSDQTGFHVTEGSFSSTGPGRLAYTKEGVAGSNIGLQALENFLYEELSGTLNYESDGNYLMSIRLDGKNPDLYDGHPVLFNLNVSGLLPEFFEAMFMTGSFEESILKQIKSQ